MIKNTDKIAEKEVNKKQAIVDAKKKMTEKLNNIVKSKQEEEKKKKEEKERAEKAAKEAKEKAAKEKLEKEKATKLAAEHNKTQQARPKEVSKTQVAEEITAEEEQTAQVSTTPPPEETTGFIRKYSNKFDGPKEVVQTQESTEETQSQKKKGMLQRFKEKLNEEEQDGQKAQEVVKEFQHAIDLNKKSVLERASEAIVQEQLDDDSEVLTGESL